MNLKILGLSGSPVADSNTERLLEQASSALGQGVDWETVPLAGLNIEDCRHCNWCLAKQKPERYCALDDDMTRLYPKVLAADGLLVASPVYLGRLSGRLAACLDRLRALHYGRQTRGCLKYKVGGALAVGWFRHSGIETTLQSIHLAFLTFQMLIAVPGSLATFGGGAVASAGGGGQFDPQVRHGALADDFGLQSARATAAAVVELARLVRKGSA